MRLTTEERRALAFIAAMVGLSVLGRWADRPRPLDTNMTAVNLDSLEQASAAMMTGGAGAAKSKSSKSRRGNAGAITKGGAGTRGGADGGADAKRTDARDQPEMPFPSAVLAQIEAGTAARMNASQPGPPRAKSHAVDDGGGSVINLNTATAAELQRLPRVGPVLAARIVAYRDSVGRFENVDALAGVKGVGHAMLERLRPRVRAP